VLLATKYPMLLKNPEKEVSEFRCSSDGRRDFLTAFGHDFEPYLSCAQTV
jgi:hypothetical protein